jgi:hypothetical protein
MPKTPINGSARSLKAISQLSYVIKAQNIAGHRFRNINHLYEALQSPKSDVKSINERQLCRGNRSLIVIGDLALSTALSLEWHRAVRRTHPG